MSTFYLTTPIYYVNALPHLGHGYTTIVADCYTRFQKIMGKHAMFITGTDEHGDKIVQAAEKKGQNVQEFTDTISKAFQDLWPRLDIHPDAFVRTTSPQHKKVVQQFLQKIYDAGDIYYGEYGGYYCYGCERFYTEKELLEDGLCPQHLAKPEYISEKNYFFRMSKYQGWLKQYLLDNPDFVRPEQYRNEALALLESGELEDLCISRPKSRLTWGIELPFDSDYVCYVWFDALLSYFTALGGPDSTTFSEYWPNAEHLIAKDILKPHAIFWPTMLKAGNMPMYKHLNVHGYWLVQDTKMSKSLGNVVAPLDLAQKYGNDIFRYFLMREMHFGHDASFSDDALITRTNADLANDLGNLYSRVLSMTAKYCASKIPAPDVDTDLESQLHLLAQTSMVQFQSLFSNAKFSQGLEALWSLVRGLNKYVDSAAPWTLAKNGDNARLRTVLYTLLEYLRKLALHLWPVMPEKASAMLQQLGQSFSPKDHCLPDEITGFGKLLPGTEIASSSNLFPRIIVDKEQEKPATTTQPVQKESAVPACCEFSDFQKLDLRIGTVVECSPHPNADKLLKVMVDLQEDKPRQILAGLAAYFSPEDLLGKQVCVVANLAPRTMRGLESQGMILAIHTPKGLELLTSGQEVPSGSKVS